MTMTPNQIEWRRRVVMNDLQQKTHNYRYPFHLHRRAYELGDRRCTHCKKWLNPDKAEELKEIRLSKRGLGIHDSRFCPVKSSYVAALVMFPKFHASRRQRVDSAKRY